MVRPVSGGRVHQFITENHYSQTVPSGKNLFYGWFVDDGPAHDLFDGSLYAVANYGIGINPLQAEFLERELQLGIELHNLLELKRLVRREPKDKTYPLTHFLSRCHRQLKSDGYKFVVSFSDPAQGHDGGIYKAANFRHVGMSQADQFLLDKDGKVHHRRKANHYAKNHAITYKEAVARLGYTFIKSVPKDRWFIEL